jgi:hypothetical protein
LRGKRSDNPPFLAILARVYARMGKRSEAQRILKNLGEDGPGPDFSAGAYTALGEADHAFRLLFRMVEKREDTYVVFIKTEPQFASLHSDPRWPELMGRMNLQVE